MGEHVKLERENYTLSAALNEAMGAQQTLQRSLEQLNEDIRGHVSQKVTMDLHIEKMEELIEDLGKRLQDREMELRKMQDENSLLTQEVTRRLDDQEELLLQHQSAAQEVEQVHARLQQREADVRALEERCKQAQAQIVPLENSLSQQYNEYQQTQAGLLNQIELLQIKIEQAQQDKHKQSEGMRIENSNLQSNIVWLQEKTKVELGKISAENAQLRDVVQGYEVQQRRLTEEIEVISGKLEKNSKRSELEARTAKEKDSLIQSQEEENKRLLEEITRLRSKIVTSSSARNVI